MWDGEGFDGGPQERSLGETPWFARSLEAARDFGAKEWRGALDDRGTQSD